MKTRILNNWTFGRIAWLIVGAAIGIQAIMERNYLLLLPAAYFFLGALAGVGCCGSAGCSTGINRQVPEPEDQYRKERDIDR